MRVGASAGRYDYFCLVYGTARGGAKAWALTADGDEVQTCHPTCGNSHLTCCGSRRVVSM